MLREKQERCTQNAERRATDGKCFISLEKSLSDFNSKTTEKTRALANKARNHRIQLSCLRKLPSKILSIVHLFCRFSLNFSKSVEIESSILASYHYRSYLLATNIFPKNRSLCFEFELLYHCRFFFRKLSFDFIDKTSRKKA